MATAGRGGAVARCRAAAVAVKRRLGAVKRPAEAVR